MHPRVCLSSCCTHVQLSCSWKRPVKKVRISQGILTTSCCQYALAEVWPVLLSGEMNCYPPLALAVHGGCCLNRSLYQEPHPAYRGGLNDHRYSAQMPNIATVSNTPNIPQSANACNFGPQLSSPLLIRLSLALFGCGLTCVAKSNACGTGSLTTEASAYQGWVVAWLI